MNRYSVSIGQDLSKNMSFSGVTKKNPEQTIHKLWIAMRFFYWKKKFEKSISFSYHPKVTFPSQVVEEEGDGGSSSSSSSVAVLSVPVVVLLAWNEN